MARLAAVASLLALTVFISAVPARAYTLNANDPDLKGWNVETLKINLNTADCPPGIDMSMLVEDAIKIWNNVPDTEIKVALGGSSTTPAEIARAGNASDSPVITCDPRFGANTQTDVAITPGVGGISVDTSTHRIVYGYILLNAEPSAFASVNRISLTKLEIVIAHEIGHILGLGHSTDPKALMYPDVSHIHRLALTPDDVAGLQRLYPPGGHDASAGPLGCGPTQNTSGHGGSGPGGPESLIAVLLVCMVGSRIIRSGGIA